MLAPAALVSTRAARASASARRRSSAACCVRRAASASARPLSASLDCSRNGGDLVLGLIDRRLGRGRALLQSGKVELPPLPGVVLAPFGQLAPARHQMGVLRQTERRLSGLRLRTGLGERGLGLRQPQLRCRLGGLAERRQRGLDLALGGAQRVAALLDLALALHLLALPRLDLGGGGQRVPVGGLGALQRLPAGPLGRCGALQLGGALLGDPGQAGALLVEPRAHRVGIALRRLGVGHVLVDLLAALAEAELGLVEPRQLALHRAQALAEAGELGRLRRLPLPQRRQRGRGLVAPRSVPRPALRCAGGSRPGRPETPAPPWPARRARTASGPAAGRPRPRGRRRSARGSGRPGGPA